MSPQAIASPEELEQFARDLKRFNGLLGDSMANLKGRFDRLGDTWRDQEQQKFALEFEQTIRVLQHFMQTSEQQIPFLQRKAQRIRDYLTQR